MEGKEHNECAGGDLPGEIWKIIPNSEGRYEVSNYGRVAGLNGSLKIKGKRALLSISSNHLGYKRIRLYINGIRKTCMIHRLVMHSFHGESDLLVDHINGIKDDNRLENLRYCSYRENASFNNRVDVKRKSSKYPGVSYHIAAKKWTAKARNGGVYKYLGLYQNEIDAAVAYANYVNEIEGIKIKLEEYA